MDLRRLARSRWSRLQRSERFVRLIISGGLALLFGLWMLRLAGRGSNGWLLGVVLAASGALVLLFGIYQPLTTS